MPASFHSSAWSWVAPGVWEDGLRMTALPAASAIGRIHIGTMTGKLNGVIAATTPSGWRRVTASTPVATFGVFMPGQVDRQAAGVLDGLDAAGDADEGVGEGLAVVAGDERRELLAMLPGQLAEGEEDLAPGDEGHVAPGREGGQRGLDRAVDLGLAAPRHAGDDLAGRRVVDRAGVLGQDLDGARRRSSG